MCGICGIFSSEFELRDPEMQQVVRWMAAMMNRRGPDDEGFWNDPRGQVMLGFRRLAVLDLSTAAHQPMVSSDGRSMIIFNGEIYNHQEIRRELENTGISFRSRSDTEVLLEALNSWGVKTLERINGMFALAWYNEEKRTLLLARDHAGIKPLYYGLHPNGHGIAFASQYNALLHVPWIAHENVRLDVLHLYLRLHYIPAPYGLLKGTYQLEPGHYMIVHPDGRTETHAWWRLPRRVQADLKGIEAEEALAEAIQSSVQRQLVADVPLGTFLSGGVDSPCVTALAQRQSGSKIKAFTIGNPGWRQDESQAASLYAEHLGVDFHLRPVSEEHALQAIPHVIQSLHEPFGDFSLLPTLLISQYARTELTVALSGDGGDELFFGYERPLSLLTNGSDFRFPWSLRVGLYGAGKLGLASKRKDVILARSPGSYYFEVNSRFKDDAIMRIAPDLTDLPSDFGLYSFSRYIDETDLANYSRYVEFYGQLQRGLKKVDMASMYHSLEVRVPLLDRQVIDVSLRIDPFEQMQDGQRKLLLRRLLSRYVPANIIPKPKLGFSVPLADWLRGPLRALVEGTFFDQPLYPSGLFGTQALGEYWNTHLDGQHDYKWGLWSMLALQWWAGENILSRQKKTA